MDADTKTLLKELNNKIQDENTDIKTKTECVNIMINMIDNYDLTNKPARICPSCTRLKHISLYHEQDNPNYDICRLCHLNISNNIKLKHIKCDVCDMFLVVHKRVSFKFILNQHNKTQGHQRHLLGSYRI